MPRSREAPIVHAVLRRLNTREGCTARKRHGTAWGVAGDPDVYGSDRGTHFEIEVKVPGARPTKLQARRLREWHGTGAVVGVARSADEAEAVLDGTVTLCTACWGRGLDWDGRKCSGCGGRGMVERGGGA